MNKKIFKQMMLIVMTIVIALCICNVAYATTGTTSGGSTGTTGTTDDDYSSDFGDEIIDLSGGETTQTTTTTTTTKPKTTTTTTRPKTTTTTTLPHTGLEDSTGTMIAIVALAVVGITSYVVIKKNNDIK